MSPLSPSLGADLPSLRMSGRSESTPALGSPGGPRSPVSPGLRSTGASVMNMSASGRGSPSGSQLMKFHYEQMEKKASGFIQANRSDDPRHVRTTVGSGIYRPGQKAENLYGISITTGAKVSQDLSATRGAKNLGIFPGAGTQTLYSPTSGLIG